MGNKTVVGAGEKSKFCVTFSLRDQIKWYQRSSLHSFRYSSTRAPKQRRICMGEDGEVDR